MDRRTGETINNFDSAVQSVEIILHTRIGDVCMLREFGAGIVELLGRLLTPALFTAFQNLIATAIDIWEPRFLVRRIITKGSVEEFRLGRSGFVIEVDYRPRGHLGDLTVEGVRQFGLTFGRETLSANPL